MDQVFQIPWDDDGEELLIIASHTSIVSYDLLVYYNLVEQSEEDCSEDRNCESV